MPPADIALLSPPDTLLVLATSPAGFGHIRVTFALKNALPPGTPSHLIGLYDPTFEVIYSLISRHPFLQHLFEAIQNHPFFEDFFSYAYRNFLYLSSRHTYDQLVKLITSQPDPPKTVIVVATHFSLAHQIGHCKELIEHTFRVRLILAVVVTDDSPHHIWAVPKADYIFTPSYTTQKEIGRFFKSITPHPPPILVSPYPLSPQLSKPLSPSEFSLRKSQANPQLKTTTHIMIPVSGAAVQLPYLQDLVKVLLTNPRLYITIVSRESLYCNPYLEWFRKFPQITVYSSKSDRQVVNLYEQAYANQIYALEVTKPSEQSFKALLPPNTRGGSILLFSPPVGRQEVDNLNFLRRHNLLASPRTKPNQWRCIRLPANGHHAGHKILSLLKTDLFPQMLNFSGYLPHPELKPNGAEIFWTTLINLMTGR